MELEYFRIHNWLTYHHGKASKCENDNCKSINPKRFEWALLKGKDHVKDRNNYIMLCPSCHRKYDMTIEARQNMSNARKGKPAHNKVKISMFSKEDILIKRFDSLTEACKYVNGSMGAFSALKRGRLKTYKKYLWKFEN